MNIAAAKKIPWLFCVGSLLLFCSWLSEKHFESQAKGQREDMDRIQARMSSNHTIAQIWYSHIRQLETQPQKNDEAIAMASIFYMEFTLNVLQGAVAWGNENLEQRREFAEFREKKLENAKAAYSEKNFEKVVAIAATLRAFELQSANALISSYYAKYNTISEQEREANMWLRVFYIIGAALVGIAFARERFAESKNST